MKGIKIVYERYNISLINLHIFIVTLTVSFKTFYDILMFKKVIKMYKNFKEIIKIILAPGGLEPSIFKLPA